MRRVIGHDWPQLGSHALVARRDNKRKKFCQGQSLSPGKMHRIRCSDAFRTFRRSLNMLKIFRQSLNDAPPSNWKINTIREKRKEEK